MYKPLLPAFLLLGACLLPSVPVHAAEGPLTLNDALRTAATTHPSVLARQDELQAASNGLETAKWQRYPGLSAEAAAGRSNGQPSTILRLEQPLWTGGRITASIDAGSANVEAAKAGVEEAEQEILIRTAATYSEIIRLKSRLDAAEENIAEHQRLLDLISRRSASQVSAESEVTMARARLQGAKTEFLQLQNLATNAIADLSQLVGYPVKGLTVPKIRKPAFPALEPAIEMALAHSPQLRRNTAEGLAAESEIRTRKAVIWPQLSARHEQAWGSGGDSTTYLALAFQPGNGLSSLSAVQEAVARKNAVLSARNVLRKDVTDGVRTDWNQAQSSQAEAEVLRELVDSTRGVYESFVRQYSAGRKTWIDVLNARREAIQARNQLADTEWGGFLAGTRLGIVTGTAFKD